jgi:hypothetical protein
MIGYTWNTNNTWTFVTDLIVPSNTWSLVAFTVAPKEGVVYLINTNGVKSATNAIGHSPDQFGDGWRIGDDADGDPGRAYNGKIANVAIFANTLTYQQLSDLFEIGLTTHVVPPAVSIGKSGTNVIISWTSGTLQSAPAVTGPWTDVPGSPTSPYTTVISGTAEFFRAIVAP